MAFLFGLLLASRWAVAVVSVNPADAELAQNLSGVLEAQVTELSGAPVAAGEELRARLGLSSGRGILGCVGEPACLQRAGTALSIDRMVVVIVSRGVGDEYLLDMKLVEVSGGSFIGNELRHPKGVEALIRDAREVVTTFLKGPAPAKIHPVEAPISEPPEPPNPPHRFMPLAVGGAGIALVGTGLALALSVGGDYDNLKQTCAPSCPESSYSSLRTRQQIGDVLMIVGGVALAGGAVWYFLQPSGSTSPRAYVAPSVGGFVVGGAF